MNRLYTSSSGSDRSGRPTISQVVASHLLRSFHTTAFCCALLTTCTVTSSPSFFHCWAASWAAWNRLGSLACGLDSSTIGRILAPGVAALAALPMPAVAANSAVLPSRARRVGVQPVLCGIARRSSGC